MFKTAISVLKILLFVGQIALLIACQKPDDRRVYFTNLVDGAKVHSPLRVKMKAENLKVKPADAGIEKGSGHFQLLVEPSRTSPASKSHNFRLDFKEGQTEAVVNLFPGEQVLTLLFVQGNNVPVSPPIFQKIRVNVVAQNKEMKNESIAVETVIIPDSLADSTQIPEKE